MSQPRIHSEKSAVNTTSAKKIQFQIQIFFCHSTKKRSLAASNIVLQPTNCGKPHKPSFIIFQTNGLGSELLKR